MQFEIPILFLVFNRPDTTKKVFERIREIKPKYLYVAADGAREDKEGEKELTKQVRRIATNIDWDCELKTLFRDRNLGCGLGVSSAIDWFFGNVEMGIILEDDVLPDLSFFKFCEFTLKEYKDDKRIMMISGFNHFEKWNDTEYSYLYAYYGGVWGWATWKRAWDKYDFKLTDFNENIGFKLLSNSLCQREEYIKYRNNLLNIVKSSKIDTWDYQWGYARIINSGLCIIPKINLVQNIGFGGNATHTNDENSVYQKYNYSKIIFPLKQNPYVIANRDYDVKFMESIFPKKIIEKKTLIRKIYDKLFK